MNLGQLAFILLFVLAMFSLVTGRGGIFNRILALCWAQVRRLLGDAVAVVLGFGLLAVICFAVFVVVFNIVDFAGLRSLWDLFNYGRYANASNATALKAASASSSLAALIFLATFHGRGASQRVRLIRGRVLISYAEAKAIVRRAGKAVPKKARGLFFWLTTSATPAPSEETPAGAPEEETFFWSYLDLPMAHSTGHQLIVGSIGSGKSVQLRLTMQSVVPRIGKRRDMRALVYDPKNEFIPALTALASGAQGDMAAGASSQHGAPTGAPAGGAQGGVPLHILNPFDARSAAWHMSADIDSPAGAYQMATALVPEEKSSQPFWVDATRHVLSAVVECLMRSAPGKWTLRDVLLVLRFPERVERVLALHPETAHVWSRYAGDERTLANLFSTIVSKLRPYEVVAALWERAATRVSLRDWARGESVLVLGESPRFKSSIDPINQLILDFIADELLEARESTTRRTFLFLDELRELGKVRKLHALANQGRSKGVSLVLGFQDIAGLREVYGDKVASEITGQVNNKTFLRSDSADTAKWSETHFGKAEYEVTSTSVSSSSGGNGSTNESTSVSIRVEDVVMASEIMGLPKTSPEHGFHAFHDLPSIGAFRTQFPFDTVIGALVPSDPAVKNHDPRPASEQFLSEWTAADLQRLSLPTALLQIKPTKINEPAGPIQPPRNELPSPGNETIQRLWNLGGR